MVTGQSTQKLLNQLLMINNHYDKKYLIIGPICGREYTNEVCCHPVHILADLCG